MEENEFILPYPGQAFVQNVADVQFVHNKATAQLAVSWTGFGASYKVSVRQVGSESFEYLELGQTAETNIVHNEVVEGEAYEFAFITYDASGRKNVAEITGYRIPVEVPETTTTVPFL